MSLPIQARVAPTTREIDVSVAWQSLLTEARDRPWLLRLVMGRGVALLEHFAENYQQLLLLSRQRRRALLRRAGTGLAGVALLLSLNGSAALALPTPPSGNAQVNGGAICELIDAINAANSDAAAGACDAGSGADTITLLGNVILTAVDNSTGGDNGLPSITSAITIEGDGHTIERDSGAVQFRIFHVAATGNLTLNNTTITGGNSGSYNGGGIRVESSGVVTITNSTISSNYGYYGGGIDNSGTLTVNNITISGNSAYYGGGIHNGYNGSTLTVNSTISGNSATYTGGGIKNDGTATVNNSTLNNNSAEWGGGLYNAEVASVNNCTISGNSADNAGGIYNRGTATISNSTISGNTATNRGGGVVQWSGTLTLEQSLLSGNTAVTYANEVWQFAGTTVGNANNLFGHGGETDAQAFVGFTPSGSDINATQDGTNVALTSILNTTLADNGGPTMTHALVSGSPAINAVPDSTPRGRAALAATCVPSTSYDQRGVFRADGGIPPTGTGEACDIGAFEFGQTPTAVTIAGFSSQTAWGSGPQLLWETGNESGLSGFHIWRGSADAAETRLTDALIGATGGLTGGEYTWRDSVAFGWGERVWYWLEAVNADGSSSFTGPVEVWGLGKLFLPAIGR